MLKAHEELWKLELSDDVEKLIEKANGYKRKDKTRAVTCEVPFNCCVQT